MTSTSTLLFRVGAGLFGCDTTNVQEIIPPRPSTRLPGAPRFVRGLINIRGTIVTVLDLGVRLGAADEPPSDGSILLVRHRDRVVGLSVDEVADVRLLDVEQDETAGSSTGGIVRGVASVDDTPVVVLDLDTLIQQVLLT
ncbi:MAG TPA: chemotaxis protein CheW [Gemmatimonadaceae bacterium]|jgi:purine-binding chemotaxis protein CheW|nr:chemotaxis protein CheW [Gemmatimonadaceae bacterium]